MIGNFNNKTNFPHKLLLTNTQVSKIRKAFANGSSANIKNMTKSEEFVLYGLTGPFIRGLSSLRKIFDISIKDI